APVRRSARVGRRQEAPAARAPRRRVPPPAPAGGPDRALRRDRRRLGPPRSGDRARRRRARRRGASREAAMLDIRKIRENPEAVRVELAKVGYGAAELDALLAADEERRRSLHRVESLRAERTKRSKEIGKLAEGEERAAAIAETKRLGEDLA